MKKLLLLYILALSFSYESAAQCTITGTANNGSICATYSGCSTIYVGDGVSNPGTLQFNNLDLSCLGPIELVINSNGLINFTGSGNGDLQLAAGSSIIVQPGGNIIASQCNGSKRIYIGNINVAACQGNSGIYTFPELVGLGGFFPIASSTIVCDSGASTIFASLNPAPDSSTRFRFFDANNTLVSDQTINSSPYVASYTTPVISSSTTYTVEVTYKSVVTRKEVEVIVSQIPNTPDVVVTQQPNCNIPTGDITINNPIEGMTYIVSINDIEYDTNVIGEFTDLPAGNYTVTARNLNGCISLPANITIHNASVKTWTGTISNNWFVNGNWSPSGVPNNNDCVIIPNTLNKPQIIGLAPPFPPFAEAGSITVLEGAELMVRSDWNLVITNELNNQGTFTIRNNGSLIQLNDVTNTGNVIMERQVTGITNLNYVYWSSAVDGVNVSQIAPSGNTNLMFEWTPTVTSNPGEYGQWSNYSGNMVRGKGYIVRGLQGTTNNTAVFNGVPRNGTITIPISRGNNIGTGAGAGSTYSAIDDNWNLLGNPYPSAISADAFLTQNAGLLTAETAPIEGTIYLWDSTGLPIGESDEDPFYGDYVYNYQGGNYISYNITGPNPSGFGGSIAAGQGFFVLMADSGPNTQNVEFNNTMRGTGDLANNNFLRQSATTSIERHRIWLDIINSNNKATSLLVGYIEGATNGMDRLFDGVEMNDTGLKFYTFAEDVKLSISGKALPFDVNETIPLGFEVISNGTFTIAINNLDGLFETTNQAIYLEDRLTNTIHDLRANPYIFSTVSGTHNDRFLLRFTNETLGIDTPEFNSGLYIISYNNEIKVTSTNNPINNIEVYDMLGRTIANYKDVNTTEFKFNLSNISNGTFIIKATLYNGRQEIKKVIN